MGVLTVMDILRQRLLNGSQKSSFALLQEQTCVGLVVSGGPQRRKNGHKKSGAV
ncbi:hypothetical protein [Shinella sp.]|uniref:hypothetical protein n=1 Tax=Shinella sp. TaxID=1870904 RepID=UPI003F6EA346